MKKSLLFVLFFILFAFSLFSQKKLIIKTETSSTAITIEDKITFKIIIRGNSLPSKITIEKNFLDNFEIISKKTYIKKKSDLRLGKYMEKIIIYVLKPKKKGEVVIPHFTIIHKTNTYKTYPITIYVSEKETSKDILFIKAVPQKQVLYINEQTLLTFELFTNMSISGVSLKEPLNISGVWIEEYPDTGTRKAEIVNTNKGQLYKYMIKRYSIFPRTKGNTIIPAITFEIITSSNLTLYRKTNPVTLYTKELDPSQTPAKYSGLVGNFTLNSKIDNFKITEGTPLKLTILITGTGNIKALPTPKPNNIKNFRLYPPEVNIKLKYSDKEIIETKEWSFTITPLKTGLLKSPHYCIWYFSPSEKRFKKICTRTYNIFVKKLKKDETRIKISPKQLPPIESNPNYLEKWKPNLIINKRFILFFLILLPLLNLITLTFISIKKKRNLTVEKKVIKNPKRFVTKELKKISKIKDKKTFVSETINFIDYYIFLLYGEKSTFENFSILKEFFTSHNLPVSLINNLTETIKELRALIYSPKQDNTDKNLLIKKLEKQLLELSKVKRK